MFPAGSTGFAGRRQATFACAVPQPPVCTAGLEPADNLVVAATNPAFTCSATVFAAETFASRGGGTARHGAWLALAAVHNAMRFFHRFQPSGAACSLAHSVRAVLCAEAACFC